MSTESAAESTKGATMMKAAEPISFEIPPAMGQMTRVVGHDVRNKLAVMKNSVYYLNMKLGHGDEKVQKHLKIMEREIASANRIMMNLMDFALMKEPVLQKSDVKAIVSEALSQASLPDHWEATIGLDDGLPPLMADAGQLQRAFTNIILRIVEGPALSVAEGTPEGGKLQITAREQNGFMEVGFSAAGLIIPEENLAADTGPFAFAGATSLGMAVSKIFVEGHGGTIAVERLARNETMFVVRLPL